jgi:hypothetical protein
MNPLQQTTSQSNYQQPSAILEIAAGFDGLTGLDELAPDMTWDDLLAATWGLPVAPPSHDRTHASVQTPAMLSILAIVRNWFRFSSAI